MAGKRARRRQASVSLFPFLSVLLCTMGILAFLSITFLLFDPVEQEPNQQVVEFQWVGAPNYVDPIFFRCRKKQVEYYDLFDQQDKQLGLSDLLTEIGRGTGPFLRYLQALVQRNQEIQRNFGTREHYPLLLAYPEGIAVCEVAMLLIEQIPDLNVGIEPMMPSWEVPYQSKTSQD